LHAAAFIVTLSYMSLFASSLAHSADAGALLISLSNGINAVSRILMGYLADRVGRQNTMVVTLFLSGLRVFALWLKETRATFFSFGI
jgi:MFS family permease